MKSLLLAGCLILPVQFLRAADATNVPAPAAAPAGFSGKVVETMNTAGYTYVRVDTGGQKVWAATTIFPVKVGDTASFAAGDAMPNYHSKSLNRDFDMVYFTSRIAVNEGATPPAGAVPALPPGHPPLTGAQTPALPPGHPALDGAAAGSKPDLTGIKRAPGGKTIAEIYAAPSKLAGKPVTVRGKVVKYNAMILGKNWLHIQDGSGSAEKNNHDLTLTTSAEAKVGDTVLVTGTVVTNKDFGAGYKYPVIIENAQVTVE